MSSYATGALVLRAPTGAGKTTRVPLELWRSGLAGQGWVALVEPRRKAGSCCLQELAGPPAGGYAATAEANQA